MHYEGFELTYCSNIHPAEGWPDVSDQLRAHAPQLKKRIAPNKPFGLGLRLSARESIQLLKEEALSQFRTFLNAEGLYVFTLNGFPYGPFHGGPVKSAVFAPDWRREARVRYTLRLIKILEALLPEGGEGGISTVPLSYKPWVPAGNEKSWEEIVRNLVRVAESLVSVDREKGKEIHLDLEPEPDGLIESGLEAVQFFENRLWPVGGKILSQKLHVDVKEARRLLQKHIAICLDTSHMAVVGETAEVIDRYLQSGARIGKVQISTAMAVSIPEGAAQREIIGGLLGPFADATYLHQVSERGCGGEARRYPDLIQLLPQIRSAAPSEWRIHFHLPLDFSSKGPIRSTSEVTEGVLQRLTSDRFTRHLEIETYTWSVLPDDLKGDLVESIEREYRWTMNRLKPAPASLQEKP